MTREIQKKAWSELATHGVCVEGELMAVPSMSVEEAIGDGLLAARDEGRLFVAVRNLFLQTWGELNLELIGNRIRSEADSEQDKETALRCLEGLRLKASGVRSAPMDSTILYFRSAPAPRNPDEDMLAAGLVMQKFSADPPWKFLDPRRKKAL